MKDTFQENLLAALKEEVAARAEVPARPVRSHRRRLVLAGGLAAVAVGAGVVGVPMLGEDPAYAVDREPDGSIRVHVTEDIAPADIDALEAKLRFFGVEAEVDWLDNGQDCAEPRAVYVGDPAQGPGGLFESVPAKDGWDWLVHPEYIGDGRTLVWEIQVVRGDDWMVVTSDLRVAEGAVTPCSVVPGDVLGDSVEGN